MRLIITFFILVFIETVSAQSTDSSAIKLEHYKKLYQSNLINANEYQRLKDRLLGIPFNIKTDPDSTAAGKLYEHYHARILGGSILLGIGGTILISEIIWIDRDYSEVKVPNGVIFYGVTGGVSAATGCLFLALGLKDRALFNSKYLSVNLNSANNQIGFACKF